MQMTKKEQQETERKEKSLDLGSLVSAFTRERYVSLKWLDGSCDRCPLVLT